MTRGWVKASIVVAGFLVGPSASVVVLAQDHDAVPDQVSADAALDCGGDGMVANQSIYLVDAPDSKGPATPREAVIGHFSWFPGLMQADFPEDELVLHPTSRHPSLAEERDSVKMVHPTIAGFDAEFDIVKLSDGWHVESASICQTAIDRWKPAE